MNLITAQSKVREKVVEVIKREYAKSLSEKEQEIEVIDQRILQVQKALQVVRYATVTNYYAQTVAKVNSLLTYNVKYEILFGIFFSTTAKFIKTRNGLHSSGG